MNTVLENLQKARELITPPEKWCVGSFEDNGARCALGALFHVKKGHDRENWRAEYNCMPEALALEAALPRRHRPKRYCTHENVACYNNSHTHDTVLKWFDRAIAIQKEHPTEKVG